MPREKAGHDPALAPYARLVDFLGAALPSNIEIVLHDCHDFSHSIVAIANGGLTGRVLGGPATDLILKIWRNREFDGQDCLIDYVGTTLSGKKLISSTFFIRDERQKVIGFFCVNRDDSVVQDIHDSLSRALTLLGRIQEGEPVRSRNSETVNSKDIGNAIAIYDNNKTVDHTAIEQFSEDFNVIIEKRITNLVEEIGVPASRLGRNEKIDIIHELDSAGTFLIKGSIEVVAKMIHVSNPTVYRYLKLARRHG